MKIHLSSAYCGAWHVTGVIKRGRLLFVCLHMAHRQDTSLCACSGQWLVGAGLLHCHYFIMKH